MSGDCPCSNPILVTQERAMDIVPASHCNPLFDGGVSLCCRIRNGRFDHDRPLRPERTMYQASSVIACPEDTVTSRFGNCCEDCVKCSRITTQRRLPRQLCSQ